MADPAECDVVMQGGITSGIIYPPFLLKLKDKYRFRSVGGTSAGAIAAAAAAAAEYGRESGGFAGLESMQKELTAGSFLLDLFQPSRATRPLFKFLLGVMQRTAKQSGMAGYARALLTLGPRHFPGAALVGAMLGAVAAALLNLILGGVFGYRFAIVALGFALTGALLLVVRRIFLDVTKTIPGNFFGICTGRADDPKGEDATVLTDWLHGHLQKMAGRTVDASPLTFGDLANKPFQDTTGKSPADLKEANINLRMVTSNLSQNQPYVLPFEAGHPFIFNATEFHRLFPKKVVEHLQKPFKNPDHEAKVLRYQLPTGFHFLPEAADLPVIVATRLSLSFPLLLTAVPLYTVRPEKWETGPDGAAPVLIEKRDLQLNWFSDGGISSNFPVHFFDGWFPRRPTFGVRLTSFPDEQLARGSKTLNTDASSPMAQSRGTGKAQQRGPRNEDVFLPSAGEPPLFTEWFSLKEKSKGGVAGPSLFRFLWAIFNTAQNYRDNMQSVLPSYRERIVQIRLNENEGGLNLAMSKLTIGKVIEKGREAGTLIDGFKFDEHRWVRFRVMMKQMESGLIKLDRVMRRASYCVEPLQNPGAVAAYPYPIDAARLPDIVRRLEEMSQIIQSWEKQIPPTLFQDDAPMPEPVLRVTPAL